MAMSVEIYKPTADELNGPALGGYLVIHGKIHDAIQLTGIDVLFDGEFANVVLNERQWTASRRVRKSGNCTITARSYLYVTTGPEYSPWASLTVVVAPTQWPPITVEVNDPPVAAAEARVEVLPTGKLLAVRARATVPRKSVKVSTSIDNYTRVWDLSPPEPGPWWNGD